MDEMKNLGRLEKLLEEPPENLSTEQIATIAVSALAETLDLLKKSVWRIGTRRADFEAETRAEIERAILEDGIMDTATEFVQLYAYLLFIGVTRETIERDYLKSSVPDELHEIAAKVVEDYEKSHDPMQEVQQPEQLEKVKVEALNELKISIDKVNATIWEGKDEIKTTAIAIPLKAEPDKSKKPITNTVVLWLDELRIKDVETVRQLTQYDFRVYTAVSNLFGAGNKQVTVNDIYRAMGNPNQSQAAPDQRRKILQSIDKMSSIRITVDTSEERAAGYRYKNTEITRENLLYTRIGVIERAGNTTEAIVILDKPCLYRFALERNQYTTVPMALLESPVSKTEDSLAIENYLLRRVSRKGCTSCTVLFSTLYENTGASTPKKRQRTREKVEKLLTHWKKLGFIESYTIGKSASKTKKEDCIIIKKKTV